jgi:hypothetical protein
LHQFHINIKYNTWSTNRVADFFSRPPVSALTMVLHSYGHEAFEWPQLYKSDLEFTTIYQLLGTGVTVTEFHLQDGLLCHMGYLCDPSSECTKMIWESHYSQMVGNFGMENNMEVIQNNLYWLRLQHDINKYIRSCTSYAIAKPTTN